MTRTTSWVAGVVTPLDAIASMNTPVSSRSLTPGRSSATAAAIAPSAMPMAARMASTSSRRLGASGRPQGRSAVDDLGVGERHRQQLGEQRRHGVGADAVRPDVGGDGLEHLDEVHRVPRDAVEVVVRDLLRHPLVPRAQEVDLPGGAHGDAAGAERSGAGVPEQRHARHVAHVGDAPEHEDVEVVGLHRREGPLATALLGAPGRRGGAQSPYGVYG